MGIELFLVSEGFEGCVTVQLHKGSFIGISEQGYVRTGHVEGGMKEPVIKHKIRSYIFATNDNDQW